MECHTLIGSLEESLLDLAFTGSSDTNANNDITFCLQYYHTSEPQLLKGLYNPGLSQ